MLCAVMAEKRSYDWEQFETGRDKRPGDRINDEDGFPAFSLVNRVTGDDIRGSDGDRLPLRASLAD